MDLEALRLSSGGWRTFPSIDELKTYVDVLTGDALRQSNARLLALVLAILVGVIGTLVILAVWLSPMPEQMARASKARSKAPPPPMPSPACSANTASTSNPRPRQRPSNPRPRQRPSSREAGLLR